MLAAFEATVRRNAKDEADWNRTYTMLSAEPPHVKRQRLAAGSKQAPAARMTVEGAEAMLARFAAADAAYG
jgi:hypothetical protein